MSQLVTIRTPAEIEDLQRYISMFEYVAFDTETTGVHKGAEVIGISICCEEDKAYYIILKEWVANIGYMNEDGSCTLGGLIGSAPVTEIKDLLTILQTKKLIGHNGLFDVQRLEENFGISLLEALHTDTMILAHLLDENRRVGLKELAVSMFGEDADAEAREMKKSVIKNGGIWLENGNKEMYKADVELMAKYGAKDALLTYKLFVNLIPELYEQGLEDFFYKDESMPLLKGPTYELNTIGLKVDTEAMAVLKKTLEAECMEHKAFIEAEIKAYVQDKYPGKTKRNTFNIGASQQLAWLLFGVMGLEFNVLTKAGKLACRDMGVKQLPYTSYAKKQFIETCMMNQGQIQQPEGIANGKKVRAKKFKAPWAYIACDKKALKKHAPRFKWIAELLEYQRKMKLLTTYIKGIETKVQYGLIRPSYLMHGTVTGRFSSKNINFQNLPRDDKRIKACIVARPGKVFVGADYSQLEPRTFAYYSQDPGLMAAFDGTSDFYSVVGMEVYGITDALPYKDGHPDAFGIKYKKLRDLSKVIALASAYGSTAFQLAPTTGKSIEETQNDMNEYFNRFPGVQKMMLEAHKLVKKQGYVTNLFGRIRRLPEAMNIDQLYGKCEHEDLPYLVRNMLNQACNFRIQSTGASIVNRAMIAFCNAKNEANIECSMVGQVHDSIIIECDEKDAENVSLLLQNAMESTTILEDISLEAIPKIGKTLAEV